MTDSEEMFEDEIIDIFAEEVSEVIDIIDNNLSLWQNNLTVDRPLKELRRAFHTLKGSGRMVNADAIGELGWALENLLNRIIDGVTEADLDAVQLVRDARDDVPKLLEAFKNKQSAVLSGVNLSQYIERSEALIAGEKIAVKVSASADTETTAVDNVRARFGASDASLIADHSTEVSRLLADYQQLDADVQGLDVQVRDLFDKLKKQGAEINCLSESCKKTEHSVQSSEDNLPETMTHQQQQLAALQKDVEDLQYFINTTSKQMQSDQHALQQQCAELIACAGSDHQASTQQVDLNALRKEMRILAGAGSAVTLLIVFVCLLWVL